MLRFFRRNPSVPFDLAAIGDRWQHFHVPNTPLVERMSVRTLPDGFERARYPFVALVQPLQVVLPDQFGPWTASVHFALERESTALLAVVHETPRQVTWYAHASTRAALDTALRKLASTNPVRWGVNEDRAWTEYEHAKALAALPPAETPEANADGDAHLATMPTVNPPPATASLRCTPIETELGTLTGRDRIHVHAIHHDGVARTLLLSGEFHDADAQIGFEMRFTDVVAIAVEETDASAWATISDFHDVTDSPWSAVAPAGRARRHVIVQAYDDLFHIACTDVTLQLGERRFHEQGRAD
jgi:hypothetical protein